MTFSLPQAMVIMSSLVLAACGGSSGPGDRGVSTRIASHVQNGPGTILIMSEIADFEWTRFCAFPPYMPVEWTEDALGFEWPKGMEPTQSQDSLAEMVFVGEDEIVARFTYRTSDGDFSRFYEHEYCYERENAVFTIEEREPGPTGHPHYVIVPAPQP